MSFIIRIIIVLLFVLMTVIWFVKFNRFDVNKKINGGQSRIDGIMFRVGIVIALIIAVL